MDWPFKISESDFFNYTWDYQTNDSLTPKISRFYRGIVEKKFAVSVAAITESEYNNALMKLHEVIEKDVMAVEPGRLYINDTYLSCYIIGSEKTEFCPGVNFLVNNFSLVSEGGKWIKETITAFNYAEGTAGNNLDYNRDFPVDYTSNLLNKLLKNTGFVSANFVMRIYGPCKNPSVFIGGHEYSASVSVEKGEYLTIDSIKKKVFLTHNNGEQTNCFNQRNKESYIFEKIAPGVLNVIAGGYKFDVTILEERSEPIWT